MERFNYFLLIEYFCSERIYAISARYLFTYVYLCKKKEKERRGSFINHGARVNYIHIYRH